MACARRRLASVFFLPRVMSFSARRWASLALCHVVVMDSCSKREVTRLRRRACRWAELRFRCRYLRAPPAMVGLAFLALVGGFSFFILFCVEDDELGVVEARDES